MAGREQGVHPLADLHLQKIFMGVTLFVIFWLCFYLKTSDEIRTMFPLQDSTKDTPLQDSTKDTPLQDSTKDTPLQEEQNTSLHERLNSTILQKSPKNPLLQIPVDNNGHTYINIRSVYLDSARQRHPGHENASVFLIEVRRKIVEENLIVGCRVGERVSTSNFKVHTPAISAWVHRTYPKLTHDFAFVDCFDLPAENGSRAFLLYKRYKGSTMMSVESERSFFIPAPHVSPQNGQTFSVAACLAVLFGPHPSFLKEWLQYQRTIGINHVYIIAEDSFAKAGGFKDPHLIQAIDEGFVSAEVWTQWLKSDEQIRYHSQLLAYDDCIYRLTGTYDYVFLVDSDEFFVPRVPGEPAVDYYIKNWCNNSGTCEVTWIRYYPDCGLGKTGEDGNVTAHLSSYAFQQDRLPKDFHSPPTVIDVGPHGPYQSVKGPKYKKIPKDKAYLAHIRAGEKPKHC